MTRGHWAQAASRPVSYCAGFTLMEVVVAVGILGLVLAIVGGSLFQALSIDRFWREDVVATRELRHAGSWFASDALNAATTSLVDGAPPANVVALAWTGTSGASHAATYSVSEGNLLRSFDGVLAVLVQGVVSASFSLSGKVLTFDLTVAAEQGGTASMSLKTYLRMLK